MTENFIPPMRSLFVTSLRATAKEDVFRNSESTWELYLENNTFSERVLTNFVILATAYYTKAEITEWFENTFFSESRKLNDSMWSE